LGQIKENMNDSDNSAETYLKQVEKIRQEKQKESQQNWTDNTIKDSKKGK